ncbi:hypothetical protein [Glycomyces arizonensis]|uniref:hypothetical protein n=1 Tax=Glycomyces arizonensis TaxID=256035 RepID=UPI000400D142|nr:hypothetical protein [Glycomyces arizonensis]
MFEPVDTTDMSHAQITDLLTAAPGTGGKYLAAVLVFCATERWTKEPGLIIAYRDTDEERTFYVNWDVVPVSLSEHNAEHSNDLFLLQLAHNLATGLVPKGLEMFNLEYLDGGTAHRVITALAGLARVRSLQ